MGVTYKPTSNACCKPIPSFRGAVVRRDALELHDSCDGIYDGAGPVGPYKPGCACMCDCHTPGGLPGWMKPQQGEALEAALDTERRISELTEHLKRAHPILGPGRLADIINDLKDSCPTCQEG